MIGGRGRWSKVALALAIAAVGPTACTSSAEEADASGDAKVDSCELRAGVVHEARVVVTNHSSETSDYRVNVRYESPDHEVVYGESPALTVRDLEPGASTRRLRFILETEGEDPSKTMACVPQVTRTPS